MVMITLYAGRFFTAVSPKKPKNTEVGSLFLLQGVVSTQESNQGLLHCRWIPYLLSYQGNPMYLGLKPNFGPVLFFFSISSRLSVKPLSQNYTEQAVQKHIADDTYPCLGNQASPPTRYMWSEWQGLQREGSQTHNLARKKSSAATSQHQNYFLSQAARRSCIALCLCIMDHRKKSKTDVLSLLTDG